MIPAGGLSLDHQRWIHPRYPFFLPVKVLSRVFRGKFVAGLKLALQQGKLVFPGSLQPLARESAFHAFLRPLFRKDWVVYAKRPFGGPEHVLHYLARYTHRVAISNHRILDVADGKVTFRWKDYAHGNKQRKMTVTAEEFLRRFMLHVLPRRFVRIRFSAFLANRRRKQLLPLCQQLLQGSPQQRSQTHGSGETKSATTWLYPGCGGTMVLIEKLTAQQIRRRSVDRKDLVDVRNRYSVSKLPRASARALQLCVNTRRHLPFEAKCVPFNLPALNLRPFWPPHNRFRTRGSGKPPIPKAPKSIQYP